METWKNIKDYEGFYQVSNMGRVKSLKWNKERILKPGIDRGGYLLVTLCAGGKRKTLKVHRLVCEAFHENPENKPCVNHIDENKTNNAADNLEWCTYEENNNHGTHNERMAKTLNKPVGQYTLDGELIKVWVSAREAQKQAGFSYNHISNVATGKHKTHKGFVWKYI